MNTIDQAAPPEPMQGRLTVRAIAAIVAIDYGTSLAVMAGPSRSRSATEPRQVAMWLAHRQSLQSLPQIARVFGGRDHTTVLHGSRVVEERRGRDQAFAERLQRLADRVNAAEAGMLAEAAAPAAAPEAPQAPIEVHTTVYEPSPAQQAVLKALTAYLGARDSLVAQEHTRGEAAARREAEQAYLRLRRAYGTLRDASRERSAAA